jgi:hypothetical protein
VAGSGLIEVLAANWAEEESADFPRLRRMPSTGVRKFLRYWGGLAVADRPTLRMALVSRGSMAFGDQPGPLEGAEAAAYARWVNSGLLGDGGLDGISLRLARNMISAARNEPEMAQVLARFDPAELERIAATESAKAPALRKRIEPLLKSRFGLTARKAGGGVWYYEDPARGLRAMVDFGGRTQLRYSVRTPPAGELRPVMLSLESAFGLIQDWDWITEAGTDDAATLLADCVQDCLTLVERAAGS